MRRDKGFTIIETIVSIALLGMIALFLLPLSTYSIQHSRWNNIRLTAMNLAYTQVEWLKTLDYNSELGLDSAGYSPSGTVKENLYL
ncbi:MAG TPA: type II secretion system protein, partial [Bacillota bacterium]|nr:type II secretion system protein [Bacillota bacterium]